MRPAARVNHLWSPDLIVSGIPVRLQKTFELSQKLFRSISSSSQTEVEHHRCSRWAVLPEIGLMILPAAFMHLHVDRSFISLNVGTAECGVIDMEKTRSGWPHGPKAEWLLNRLAATRMQR